MIFQKIISANKKRISRFHDGNHNRVELRLILKNFPRSIFSWLGVNLFESDLKIPWISYEASDAIEAKLRSTNCSVLEFGSGASTLWFLSKASHITSVESDLGWYKKVREKIQQIDPRMDKVEYVYADSREAYIGFVSLRKKEFDVLLVDGPDRYECLINNMDFVKPGGLIYLDNTDAESSSGEDGEMDRALLALKKYALQRNAIITRYTDFAPSCLFATEGHLLRLPMT